MNSKDAVKFLKSCLKLQIYHALQWYLTFPVKKRIDDISIESRDFMGTIQEEDTASLASS